MTKPEVGKPASFTDIAFDSGAIWERERRAKWLDRVRTWNPEKSDNWLEGYEAAQNRIIKLLEKKQGFCHEISRGKKCDHEQCKWFPYLIELIKEDPK